MLALSNVKQAGYQPSNYKTVSLCSAIEQRQKQEN
jgi:hypothetical protein